MPDLLSSLAAANGSHESFHSTHTSPDTAAAINQDPANTNIAALQAAGLSIYDIDAYLADPKSQALLNDTLSRKQKGVNSNKASIAQSSSSSTEPVLLGGPKTSHNTQALYDLCNRKGVRPEFEYEGDERGFSGSVTINGQTISTDKTWPTKKAAKEGLAERAIPLVNSIVLVPDVDPAAAAADSKVNWIGKLLGKTLP